MKNLLLFIATMLFVSQASGEVLYSVNFNSPAHSVGQPPALGGSTYPKDKPTRFGFAWGTAEVVANYGTLNDQPLLLIPEPHSSRPSVRLDFNLIGKENFPRYIMSVDMYLASFESGLDYFNIYFDTPISHQISFRYDGTIYQRGDGTVLSSFNFDEAFNFKVDVDIENNNWSLFIDDGMIYSGIFHKPFPAHPEPPEKLEDVILILDYDDNTVNIPVAVIDNFSITAIPELVLVVDIDIKPGSYPNAINLGSHGLTPVAIFSMVGFDATSVDPNTVNLAGAPVAMRGKDKFMVHKEDVDEDGLIDLVIHVVTADINPTLLQQDGDVIYAVLTGNTSGGEAIEGEDEIVIVPPK